MSYDIYLRSKPCESCGRSGGEPELPDPTYNLTPIFDLALTGEPMPNADTSEAEVVLFRKETDRPRGLRLLSGRTAVDTIPLLGEALHRLENPDMRAAFEALEPSNKWGTHRDAITVMRKLRDAAVDYPDHTWEIH